MGRTEHFSHLREELHSLLSEHTHRLGQPLDDDTPLISSGVLDSLAVFNLVVWIEGKLGKTVDPLVTDFASAWDTVALIIKFIEDSTSPADRNAITNTNKRPGAKASELEIVEYSPDFKDMIAQLQTQLWSANVALNKSYFDWKYEANPYGTEPQIYLAFYDDSLIGMRGFYPSKWQFGANREGRIIFVADDTIVHNEFRSKGVMNTLMSAAYEGLKERGIGYLFNLSGGDFTVKSSLASGWQSVGSLRPILRMSPSERRRNQLRHAMAQTPLLWRYAESEWLSGATRGNPFAYLDRQPNTMVSQAGVTVSVSRHARPGQMARLVGQIGDSNRIRHVRDETYLAWRFKNPLREYRFLYVGESALDGFMVIQCERGRGSSRARVNIVDLEAVNEQVQDALLETILRPGLLMEVFAWSVTLPIRVRDALSRAGFKLYQPNEAVAGPTIIVRSTDDFQQSADLIVDGLRIVDIRNWDMRMIYSMAG